MKPQSQTAEPTPIHHVTDQPISMLGAIFGSHLRRIGVLRVVIGGGSMYLYIPFMIFMHTTFAVLIYQCLLRPLLGLPKVQWRDHVIIDRHRIDGLTWFDKFNCMFCGYANGVCTMMNKEMDHLANLKTPVSWWQQPLVLLASLFFGGFMVMGEPMLQTIYNVLVSRPLGMHRVSIAQAHRMLQTHRYGEHLWLPLRLALLISKNHTLRFSMALEQIESSWCPLKHFETRNGIVYPDHHRRFFGPEQIREMSVVLTQQGTVSERKPTW